MCGTASSIIVIFSHFELRFDTERVFYSRFPWVSLIVPQPLFIFTSLPVSFISFSTSPPLILCLSITSQLLLSAFYSTLHVSHFSPSHLPSLSLFFFIFYFSLTPALSVLLLLVSSSLWLALSFPPSISVALSPRPAAMSRLERIALIIGVFQAYVWHAASCSQRKKCTAETETRLRSHSCWAQRALCWQLLTEWCQICVMWASVCACVRVRERSELATWESCEISSTHSCCEEWRQCGVKQTPLQTQQKF